MPYVAYEHEDQAADDESDDCKVEQKHGIRQQAVGAQVLLLRSLDKMAS